MPGGRAKRMLWLVRSIPSSQAERVAANRALAADVFSRLAELHGSVRLDDVEIRDGFLCECADPACAERLPLQPRDYEAARKQGLWYLVAPGHCLNDPSEIVLRTDDFELVRPWQR